jgi:murein DD-endopeptidase MepM/ murein hydrolase activator NlpD
MAQKVGEMQAKLIKLEAMGERVSGLAGVKGDDIRPIVKPEGGKTGSGQGGPFVPATGASLEALNSALDGLDERTDQHFDLFTLIESRLFEARLKSLMIPNSRPLLGPVGSGFGFRTDPFSGRAALHTGLDFPAETGTPIMAAAGGVVISAESHPAYGNVVEIDHGNRLVTRYAHASKVVVKAGDLVKRGQVVAHVGNSGRSTGPHLHFEVLVEGVPQDPAKFLAGNASATRTLAARSQRSARSGRPRPEPAPDVPRQEPRPDPPSQE